MVHWALGFVKQRHHSIALAALYSTPVTYFVAVLVGHEAGCMNMVSVTHTEVESLSHELWAVPVAPEMEYIV